jgi:hypothetical protein
MSLKYDETQEQFYHGVGRFETPVYNLNCDFCDRKVNIPYGNLPTGLDVRLMMAHVDGILGRDFFRNFKIMLDFKGGKATVANQ